MSFVVPTGPDYTLQSLEMALNFVAGANELDVLLVGDRVPGTPNPAGIPHEPDTDSVLEQWRISNRVSGASGIVLVESVGTPTLVAGERYWVMLSVPEPDSEIRWWAASTQFSGPAMQAERNSSLDFLWRVAEWETGEGSALRVMANAG